MQLATYEVHIFPDGVNELRRFIKAECRKRRLDLANRTEVSDAMRASWSQSPMVMLLDRCLTATISIGLSGGEDGKRTGTSYLLNRCLDSAQQLGAQSSLTLHHLLAPLPCIFKAPGPFEGNGSHAPVSSCHFRAAEAVILSSL